MTNLVDLSTYPPQHRCPCGIAVREVGGRWTDGAGGHWCWTGHLTHAGVPIAPSVLLDAAILRGEQ